MTADADGTPPRPRRRGRGVLVFLLVCALLTGAAASYGFRLYATPGPLKEARNVVIPRGAGLVEIADLLVEAKVLADPYFFGLAVWATGASAKLKSGEYQFTAAISPQGAIEVLTSGRTVVRRLTVPEGFTTAQVIALLRAAEGLEGDIGAAPGEGELLPETYHYSWGEPRARMLARQRQAMADAVKELWDKRAANLPIKSPTEAIILASIVEKETGRGDERARVAAVFVNRLRRGMKLQADPTVAYGVAKDGLPLERALTRADLDTPHRWNTYVIEGLPPTPIANPGRAALAAVLTPAATDELYFVAAGNGGHVFAKTLAEHNRNVAQLRRIEAEQAGAAAGRR